MTSWNLVTISMPREAIAAAGMKKVSGRETEHLPADWRDAGIAYSSGIGGSFPSGKPNHFSLIFDNSPLATIFSMKLLA